TTMTGRNRQRNGTPGYRLLAETARDLPGAERVTFHSTTFDAVAFPAGERLTFRLKRTDGEFWRVFRFEFPEGGPFSPEDDAQARFVAVINESTPRRYFGGGPAGRRKPRCGRPPVPRDRGAPRVSPAP